MDHILAGFIGAALLLTSAAWQRPARRMAWPGTAVRLGRMSRLGLGLLIGCVAALLFLGDEGEVGWWFCYLGGVGGLGLATVGYHRNTRSERQVERM